MKPILFNTEMVKAILEGRKTVTRRVVKPQPVKEGPLWQLGGAAWSDTMDSVTPVPCHSLYDLAPFHPGDILYVRETWKCQEVGYPPRYCVIEYKAGGLEKFDEIHVIPTAKVVWKPSIHMPKSIARIFLRVKSIRLEQLQSMTEKDALSEGIPDEWPMEPVYCPECQGEGLVGALHPGTLGYMEVDCPHCEKAVTRFSNLWDSTIPKHPNKFKSYPYYWKDNPWVWVIEFERCEKPTEE